LIDWTVEKYRANMEKTRNEQEGIIDGIIKELVKKRDIYTQNEKSYTRMMEFSYESILLQYGYREFLEVFSILHQV
jgi:hypothetical protein